MRPARARVVEVRAIAGRVRPHLSGARPGPPRRAIGSLSGNELDAVLLWIATCKAFASPQSEH
jgi:hypothetical protein